MRDPYKILGVAKSADPAAVKSAYRKLAKKLHPDQNTNDPKAKERFAELGAAYEILGDEDKRRAFDRGEIDAEGNPTMAGFNPFNGGGAKGRAQGNVHPNFDDLFAQFSSGRSSGFRSARPGGAGAAGMGGEDINVEDVLRSMFGGAGPGMDGGFQRERHHPSGSSGAPKGSDVNVQLAVSLEEIVANAKVAVELPGSGSVRVGLPKGVSNGQTIRLKGKGKAAAHPSSPAGDALITVTFKPHSRFRLEGANLVADLPVSLSDAVLGAKIEVDTLDGKVAVSVPKGASSGSALRLKGRGMPTKAGARGDLLLKTQIKLPEGGDEALEALMTRWRVDGKQSSA